MARLFAKIQEAVEEEDNLVFVLIDEVESLTAARWGLATALQWLPFGWPLCLGCSSYYAASHNANVHQHDICGQHEP